MFHDGPPSQERPSPPPPLHTLTTNLPLAAVISDYVPRGIQVPVRVGVVGLSALTALGLTKLALAGVRMGV